MTMCHPSFTINISKRTVGRESPPRPGTADGPRPLPAYSPRRHGRRVRAIVAPRPSFAGRHRVWVLLVLVGLVSSVLAKLVDLALGWLLRLRLGVLGLGTAYGAAGRLGLWVGWSLAAVALAVALTEGVNPAAKGSGIPQMKALLAGGSGRGRCCHNYVGVVHGHPSIL